MKQVCFVTETCYKVVGICKTREKVGGMVSWVHIDVVITKLRKVARRVSVLSMII